MIAVLCGGVGAARFLSGLLEIVPPADVTAIVNTGDDTELHGLSISLILLRIVLREGLAFPFNPTATENIINEELLIVSDARTGQNNHVLPNLRICANRSRVNVGKRMDLTCHLLPLSSVSPH